MFSDIRRFQQDTASSPDPAGSPLLSCALLSSLSSVQEEDTGSSLKDPGSVTQSERDLFLASLGYNRYSDPYFLPTS
jgi:hypothetical protein